MGTSNKEIRKPSGSKAQLRLRVLQNTETGQLSEGSRNLSAQLSEAGIDLTGVDGLELVFDSVSSIEKTIELLRRFTTEQTAEDYTVEIRELVIEVPVMR